MCNVWLMTLSGCKTDLVQFVFIYIEVFTMKIDCEWKLEDKTAINQTVAGD